MKKISIIPIFGDKGAHVETIQIKLNELGFNFGNIDGSFGNQTKNAIVDFQSLKNLTDDGILTIETLALIGIEVENKLSNNPFFAIPSIVDKTQIAKIRWENGNRGQAPYGFYYGVGLVYATLYERLKKGEKIAQELATPIGTDRDKDALLRFQDTLRNTCSNNLDTDNSRLRGLIVLMFGLGLMESSGRYCCGWDRGKVKGWGNPAKKITPTSVNSEAGLFQTSFDIIDSVSNTTKNLLLGILAKYRVSQDGYIQLFSKGVNCIEKDLENFGDGHGRDFQKLSKENPAFALEFTALSLRHVASHWNPVIKIGDDEKGLQIKHECDELLKNIETYINENVEISSPPIATAEITLDEIDQLKQIALNRAEPIGQKDKLNELFNFALASKANFWAIVDFTKPRTEKRLFIFDLKNKEVKSYCVSHGKNSGDLYAKDFSNTINSNKSCVGIFKTGTTYIGNHGRSLYLNGLQTSNDNTRERYIVIHQAPYVTDEIAGRSLGCFVVSPNAVTEVIDNLRDGSYILAWK